MSGGFPFGLEICNGNDQGSNTATSLGTALTTGGTADTYGAFTQLVASTPSDTEWVCVTLFGGRNTTSFQAAIEIAVGASGSENVIIHDLVFQCNMKANFSIAVPISIPAVTRISAAVQSQTASETGFFINLQLFDGAFPQMEGIAGVDSIGFTSASTQGTTVTASATTNTKGSYSQLSASTPRDYIGFFFALGELNVASVVAAYLLDIAIGASGAEQVILPNFALGCGTIGEILTPGMSPLFPIPIPAGTRVAARSQSTLASANLDLTLYGLYQ